MFDDIKKALGGSDDFKISPIKSSEDEFEDDNTEIIELMTKEKKVKDNKKREPEIDPDNVKSFIKVPFSKFVQLVAVHDFEKILDKYAEEQIVLSTSLLTDLANSHEPEEKESKIPLFFVVGVIFGIVL